jgi:hypothetical protein
MERRSFLFVVFRSFSFRTALDTWLHIRCHHTTHVIETDRLTDTGALSHVTSLGTPVSHFGSVHHHHHIRYFSFFVRVSTTSFLLPLTSFVIRTTQPPLDSIHTPL